MLPQTIYEAVPYVLAFATAGALVLSWYAWRRRQHPAASWLTLMVFTAGLWTGFDLFNYLADLPRIEIAVKQATWALILTAGLAFFRFACIHARREQWWDRARVPVVIALAVNLSLMVTNGQHQLLWPGVRWVDFGFARVPWLESGPAFFWVFRPTAVALPLAGVLALVASAVGSPIFYLRQIAVLALAAVILVVVNIVFESTSVPGLDVTPVAVVIVVTACAWSTFRFGLLDVMPVARSLLLEQLDDGVIVLDRQRRVVDVNPAAVRLLGRESWTPGTPVEDIVSFWNTVQGSIEAGGVQTVAPDESGTVLELQSSPIGGEERASRGRFIVLHDVTARTQLIRELDAYAHRVAQDLKDPLALLTRSIDDMCTTDERLGKDSLQHLRSVGRVCRQMTETVDALLCFAQLRSLEEVAVEPLGMPKIVEATLQRLSAVIARASAEIIVPERWPAAVGHPTWVEEIWTNYISNAIKYGGHPPHVELGASPQGASAVRYWVRDDGPGLSERQRGRLFTEFTRLDPQRAEGHGLGLSIVQRIAEKLGGRVGCDSIPGHGSTFWFTLPGVTDTESTGPA